MREFVQRAVRHLLRIDGEHHVREGIGVVRVAAVLRDHELRFERRDDGVDDGVQGAQPVGVAGTGRQGDVDGAAFGVGAADVAGEAGAREENGARLVDRDREHPRVVPEDLLDAVTVVNVDVDVGDPLDALVEQPLDADRSVVVDAETARLVGHGVVQAPGEVDRVARLA